ncbi:hypothetical protein A3Q56_08512 [Intoshia linei]|uniref:Uncharacterized protein n=1 Tax=Intoshia linei TaxID=1819745 RepID=A0A177AQH3_9BILA|nr:hypothetical protein A3Q56_08512 [Intoshia linei]
MSYVDENWNFKEFDVLLSCDFLKNFGVVIDYRYNSLNFNLKESGELKPSGNGYFGTVRVDSDKKSVESNKLRNLKDSELSKEERVDIVEELEQDWLQLTRIHGSCKVGKISDKLGLLDSPFRNLVEHFPDVSLEAPNRTKLLEHNIK